MLPPPIRQSFMYTCAVALILLSVEASDRELTIDEISERNVKVGQLLPWNPHAIIGQTFQSTCTLIRRKLLRQLNIAIDDVFFRFSPARTQIQVVVPRQYMTIINQSTVELRYPNVTIDFHRGDISCLARINNTSVLHIDDHILYVGYSPGVGYVVKVITEDLMTVRVTFGKSHNNPSYPTTFTLLCRFREDEKFEYCPNQTTLTNDTIEFLMRLQPGQRYGDNQQPIAVRIKSSSLLGGVAIGNVTTFSLYEKFKPQSVSDIVVKYSGGQTATVQWTYPDSVPLGLRYTVFVKSKWDVHAKIHSLSGTYFETGPFSQNLVDLHWATLYNITISVKPVVYGYASDDSAVVSFVTEESIPAANPLVMASGYERRIFGEKQDVIIYWQPVPEFFWNGIITETKVQIFVNQRVRHLTVNESEATLSQAHIKDLHLNNDYLFAVVIGTSKGMCHEIAGTVNVASLEKVLPPLENLTAIISTNNKGKRVVQMSWKPYHLSGVRVFIHWCVGRHGYPCQDVLHTFMVKNEVSDYTFVNLSEPYTQYKFGASIENNRSNSGLHWVNCTYDISKVPQKPSELRSAEVHQDEAYIYVGPGLCTPSQGYPYLLTVVIQNEKNDVTDTQTFLVDTSGKYAVTSLKPMTNYTLSVYAESVSGRSHGALKICFKTQSFGVEVIIKAVVGIIVLLLIIVIVFGCFKFYKEFKKKILVATPSYQDDHEGEQRQVPDGGSEHILMTNSHKKETGQDQGQYEGTFTMQRNCPEGDASSSSRSSSVSLEFCPLPDASDVSEVDSCTSGSHIEQYKQCHIIGSSAVGQHLYTRGHAVYADEHSKVLPMTGVDVHCKTTDEEVTIQKTHEVHASLPRLLMQSDGYEEDTESDEQETGATLLPKANPDYL